MGEKNFRRSPDGRRRIQSQPDRIFTFVNKGDETVGLMEFLMQCRPDTKRNDVKKWLKFGQVMLAGKVTSAFDAPVEPGMEVKLNIGRPFTIFRHPRIEIVYEDDDVIVLLTLIHIFRSRRSY
ncbi:MAG: hypothetical protein K2J23_03880, partial [Muribaculaceae bacterium]|nr:hypothetical protein [Muribaculaceae bacterium]